MSFTTINTFNSNLWKGGGKLKPSLYGLSVTTADLNVNSITLTYRYSNIVSYVMIDMIGSSGYISSQPRYNVVSSPVTKLITGLNPNTYYNFVLVPYDTKDISGSSYYFSGFTSGVSTFTSSTAAITSTSTPINYSNLAKPLCTLSAINSLTNTYNTTTNINNNSMTFNMSCTDMSYVIVNVNETDYIISKPAGSGSIINLTNTQSLNLPFSTSTLTTAYTYSYTVNIYNNIGIANPVPKTGSYTRPALIASRTGGVIDICNNYYVIQYISNGSITFNNISSLYTGNVLIVGGGGGGGGEQLSDSGGGGGGGGEYKNIDYIFNSTSAYNITVGAIGNTMEYGDHGTSKKGGNTTVQGITILNALGGGAGGSPSSAFYIYPPTSGACGGGGNGGQTAGAGSYSGNDGAVGTNGYKGGQGNFCHGGGGGGAGGPGGYTSGLGYRDNKTLANFNNGGIGRVWSINNGVYAYGGRGSWTNYDPLNGATFYNNNRKNNDYLNLYPTPGAPGVFIIAFLAQ